MKNDASAAARKRPVNLTLSEEVVRSARGLTSNLSGVVEALLIEYVESARAQQAARASEYQATAALWNDFADRRPSFADEHSTL